MLQNQKQKRAAGPKTQAQQTVHGALVCVKKREGFGQYMCVVSAISSALCSTRLAIYARTQRKRKRHMILPKQTELKKGDAGFDSSLFF
jgi:phage portal protein BeeE